MINDSGPEETTFASAHSGDLVQIAVCSSLTCTHPPGDCPRGWRPAVRLLAEPRPCPDGCGARCCTGVTTDGHTIPVHAAPTRRMRVVEHGPRPTRRSA
ncbi:hypothetical protein [Sphaerisporangium sp. TRM90804]|uniref:hypothetical protein n=1 Tax=Sphaerisporangium sp. TRM90804 TaxID=3031113 RepID=UPI00244D2739|nr:hypothetical protein [Sphaerisporangium sp. TRM90804]MDH2425737.1 hypothetical protein [Sphaerisporangium sp. TRM90804]